MKNIKHNERCKECKKRILELITKENTKQIGIIKKAHYKDKVFTNLLEPKHCFGFIKLSIEETRNLYDLVYNLYKGKL